jgi:GGDEF domain-containing protein
MHATAPRVLLAATEKEATSLRALLLASPRPGWDVTEANSFEQARFLLQMEACEVLLLDSSLLANGDPGGASWLAARREAPVLLLAEPTPDVLRAAAGPGGYGLVPRSLALDHPSLLHTALLQACRQADLYQELRRSTRELSESRQRIEQLAGRLWECSPAAGPFAWYSQRHVLERLHEEVARVHRHGGPLAVAVGELLPPGVRLDPSASQQLTAWLAERVGQAKRRSDVAGQFGPTGLALILPRTAPEAAAGACNRLRGVLEEAPSPLEGGQPALAVRFGVAGFSSDVSTPQSLLRRAEENLELARG